MEKEKVKQVGKEKPTKPCWCCDSMDWWLTSYGQYVCGVCHPRIEDKEV